MPLFEARNKVVRAPSALAMRRFENREVARLAAGMGPLPRVRVATIIATYRRPELLHRAVRSALGQSVHDHMVLVVDDGGGLVGLPASPQLLTCSLSANCGTAGVVRNVGIRLTRSDYVAFLDDDNEWEPDHLAVALSALEAGPEEQRPAVVYTGVRRAFPDGRLMDALSVPFDRRRLRWENYIDTSAMVIRRFPGLHFSRLHRPKRSFPGEDWELAFRLSRRMPVVHVPSPTVHYLVNSGSFWRDWGQEPGC
jgi:glycosyltransferase involved in cell wall biosynthesis